jgi:RNA polymerase-binding transcription factor DksA
MTKEELEGHRQRLFVLGNRLKGADSALAQSALRQAGGDASGGLSNAPLHMADLGTDNYEQEVSSSLLENERQIEGQVAAALDRIEKGTFGRCERCGKEIGQGRLEALPYARFCVDCARAAEEMGEGGNPVRV